MKLKSKKYYIYILLFFISIIGVYTYQDYGIGIEEHFQRKSGFYWLNFLLSYTDFEILKHTALVKLDEIKLFTPRLFPIEQFGFYGVLFDVPLAFIETLFNIENPNVYFYLRHISIFLIFLISGFCFYKIVESRFQSINLALIGFIFYTFSPRIYGNIFFDNKDIFFLSIFTINIFFFQKYLKKKKFLNLIVFSFFCALTTSSRIIGLLVPIAFFIILIFEGVSSKNIRNHLFKFLIFLTTFFLILIIHWPYLWTLNLKQISDFFEPFFYAMNPWVFFNGEFYQSKYLPYSYIPLWIMITTPVYVLIFFIFGFYYHAKRIFMRFVNIKEKLINNHDLWRSNNENFDFFLFINFILVALLYVSINPALLSGWRHFYFINFFIIYYSCYFLNIILFNFEKKIIFSILIFFCLFTIYENYKYHPFQSVYFNNFVSNEYKKNFEIDTQSLSRVHAIKELLKENGKLNIGTASWTPLEDARSLLPVNEWKRLNFVGTEYDQADFIYSNFYYEVNINFNKKYEIPESFSLYKTFKIDGTRIYSLYKKF